MKKENKISKNEDLIKKTKELLAKAKKNNLIKSHILAFKDTPVEKEEHKGQLKVYR